MAIIICVFTDILVRVRSKFLRKHIKVLKLWARNKRLVLSFLAIIIVAGGMIYANYMQNRRLAVDPATYAQLLQLIARAESNDNYNAHFGNAGNTSIKFTDMTIGQVLRWQSEFIDQGNVSSAVGRYQIINTTLSGLITQFNISTNEKFDAAMQDRLAILLIERRGSQNYVNAELTPEQFAHNLSKEWAGLPRVIGDKPGDSYYAGDGLNKSRVSVGDTLKAIAPISPKR